MKSCQFQLNLFGKLKKKLFIKASCMATFLYAFPSAIRQCHPTESFNNETFPLISYTSPHNQTHAVAIAFAEEKH